MDLLETIMIIQCDNCSTKFRLDDSRITEAGVRVRCSRCSHTFIVRKEAHADEDTFDALLAGFGSSSAGDESPEQPDRSEERGMETEPAAQDHAPEAPAPSEPFAGLFQEEVSLPQFRVSDALAEKAEEEVSDGPEPAACAQETETPAEAPAPPEPFAGFFQKGVALPQFRECTGPDDIEGEPAEEIGQEHEAAAAVKAEETTSNDSPAEEFRDESLAPVASESPKADEWGILAAAKAKSQEDIKPPIQEQRNMVAEDHDLPPLSIASRRRGSPLSVLLLGLLLILIVAFVASAILFKWPVDPASVIPPSIMKIIGSASSPGNFAEIRSLNGEFLVNREAGEIFAITGEALNTSGKALTALRVRGTVYDSVGQVLAQRTVYCGNSLSRDQMAGMSFAELEKAMGRQFGDSLANLDVASGKSLPFVVVFKGVPRGGANFGAVVVDWQGAEPKKR
jgi:predicted Zn finger-like uncharacterized protein